MLCIGSPQATKTALTHRGMGKGPLGVHCSIQDQVYRQGGIGLVEDGTY